MSSRKEVSSLGIDRLAQIALVAVGLIVGAHADVAQAQETVIPFMDGDARVVGDGMGNYVITAGDGSIIEYNMFSLNADRMIQFVQGGASARLLNRVVMFNPSMLNGTINADGRVYIVNPSGISIGPNGKVNAQAFYAVAGDLSNADFLNGIDRFTSPADAGSDFGNVLVDTGGEIHARDIYLIGRAIENRGTIMGTGGGLIAMVTGNNEVIIQQLGTRITVMVDGATLVDDGDFGDPSRPPFFGTSNPSGEGTARIRNSGLIQNAGGRTFLGAGDIASFAFHNTDTGRIIDTEGGQIDVRSVDGLALNEGEIDSSSEFFGGTITFKAPSVVNDGVIRAAGGSGQIYFFGNDHAFLTSGSVLSAPSGLISVGSFDNLGITIVQGTSGLTPGATIDVSGAGGLIGIFGPSFIMNGNLLADGGTTILDVSGNGQGLRVSDVRMNDDLDLSLPTSRSLTGYVLSTSLTSTTGAISLNARRDIDIDSTLTLTNDNDLFMRSRQGNIFINAGIVGARDLTVLAPTNTIFVRAPLEISDDALFQAMAISLAGGTIASGGTQQYVGDVFLGSDMALSGTQITFFREVASRDDFHSLSIDADLTTFNGRVGGDGSLGQTSRHLASLLVNGAIRLNAESIRTNGSQTYNGAFSTGFFENPADGPVVRTFVSRFNGDITFNDALNIAAAGGPESLEFLTGGSTIFNGVVGGTNPFASITTDAAGQTIIGNDITAGTLNLNDAVVMGADSTVTGTTAVNFNSSVTGTGQNLNVVSPLTNFGGNVSGLGTLTTDAIGVTNINAASVQTNAISFGDDVLANVDTSIFGNTSLNFDKSLNGAVNVQVGSNTLVRFGGNVGDTTPLASLRIDAGGTGPISQNPIVVNGSIIQAIGDILINPGGRSAPAAVATLAAMGNIVITSQTGNIFVGENEKITSLANLTIMAANGIATLNDLNAVNSISVMAATILLRARAAGNLLDFNGNTVTDRGMEVIAGDSIFMSTNPQIIGSGAQPVFATRSGANINGVFGFSLRPFADLDAGRFTFNPVLDLTVRNDSDLAPAFDNGLEFEDRVLRDPFTAEALEAIGIAVSGLDDEEFRSMLEGNHLIVETQRGGLTPETPTTNVHRLNLAAVRRMLDIHSRIFLPVPPLDSDEARADFDRELAARREEVRQVLSQAWDAYTKGGTRSNNPAAFRTYLIEAGTYPEALEYLTELESLCRALWTTGVTPLELQASENVLLGPVCPSSINVAEFREAIGVNLIG